MSEIPDSDLAFVVLLLAAAAVGIAIAALLVEPATAKAAFEPAD